MRGILLTAVVVSFSFIPALHLQAEKVVHEHAFRCATCEYLQEQYNRSRSSTPHRGVGYAFEKVRDIIVATSELYTDPDEESGK